MHRLHIEITDSNREIQKNIVKAIRPQIIKFFNKTSRLVRSDVRTILRHKIFESATWRSLMGQGATMGPGTESLMAHFGIPQNALLYLIVEMWVGSVDVNVRVRESPGEGMVARLTVHGIKHNYSDVLGLNVSKVTNISEKYPTGQELPWLEWLLLRGDDRFISGYEIKFGDYSRSRSGHAIMIEKPGSVWHVPAEHASAGEMNWITNIVRDLMTNNMPKILLNNFEESIIDR